MIARTYTPPGSVVPFFIADQFSNFIVGPVGSGKTTGGIMKIAFEARRVAACPDGIRRSRVAVVRNTRQMLTDTTIPDFLKWFPEGDAGVFMRTELKFLLRFDDVQCEVLFRGLDDQNDVRRLLSLQLSFGVMDEFREIHPDVYDALTGRLGRYPDKSMNGVGCRDDAGRQVHKVWGMSNPPDFDTHWERVLTEPPENCHVTIQPSGLSPEADWVQYLPDGYYENLMLGKSEDWVDVYVHGKFGASLSGRPVYDKSFSYDTHVAKSPLLPFNSVTHPIVVGMDFGRCYDDKTEVLTETGWKLFRDVADTEKVATLHPDTRRMEYTPINFKVEYDYEGDMLCWEGPNIDLCVTPEHRFPYTRRDTPDTLRWASAEELSQQMAAHRYAIVAAREWVGAPVAEGALPLGMDPVTYATFLGWWMADGCVESDSNRVCISQTKPAPGLALVADALRGYGLAVCRVGETTGIRFSSKELADHLRAFGAKHTGERRVPDIIRAAPPEIISAFLMAYTAGDGHIRAPRHGAGTSEEHTIWFNNRDLAGQFQELAQKLGWGSSLRWQKGGVSTFSDGRQATCAGGWVVRFKKGWERVELLPSQFSRVRYAGKIYCLNVPYHTLCVRRNGKVSWNGNTPAAAIGQRNTFGQVLVYDELVSENMGLELFIHTKLKPLLAARFPGAPVLIGGDPAGWAKSQINEKSCADVLREAGFKVVRPPSNATGTRLRAVESFLLRQMQGRPGLLIDPRCTALIKGFRGGYRYKVKKNGELDTDTNPEKNEFSHCHDALQYMCLVMESGMVGDVPEELPEPEAVDAGGWT